jgi:hypothetical protein
MSNNTLALRQFDISATDPKRVVVIIGKRNSGKSQCCADWLYHKRSIPSGIVMSATEEATGFFKGVCGIPDTFIYNEWQPDVIESLIAKQVEQRKKGVMRDCFVVLDDLAFDNAIFKSKPMRQMLFNGRHHGICLIITAQAMGDLPVFFRTNIDYVVVYRTPGRQDRERLWKNFFGIVPTFPMFCAIMDRTTENYECLILDNTVQSNALQDCIFWYKAPLRTPSSNAFRMGSSAFHAFHDKYSRSRRAARKRAPPPLAGASHHQPVVEVKKLKAAPKKN